MATRDRRPYLTATTLDQGLLDQMADNLCFGLEMVADIERPGGFIRASDRNKYVGTTFYQALCQFPTIKRTMGDWLSPTIEFSTLELPLSNVNGRFNSLLPGGASFGGWIGKTVNVRLGLRSTASTYFSIYRGRVTEIGGVARDRAKIAIRTRDDLDQLNVNFPRTALTQTAWPNLDDALAATVLPVVYGDWRQSPLQQATGIGEVSSVPAFPVNGKAAGVLSGATPIRLIVSENDNRSLDLAAVWLKRGDGWALVPSGNVGSVVAYRDFQVTQGFTFDASPYVYKPGDQFFVKVEGKDIGAGYQDNAVWQARDLLASQAGASAFSSAWASLRDKAAPSGSDIANIKCRVWQQEPESVVTYALSILEQIRVEMFVNRSLELHLTTLHLEDFPPSPAFRVRQWDIAQGTFSPRLDDRNIWNRARAEYAFDPASKGQLRQSPTLRNALAIAQAGKTISKKVVFPNLYVEADVVGNLDGMLRLATGNPEMIEVTLSPRALLQDLGGFVQIDVNQGSTVMRNTPAMIRQIGNDPRGSVPAVLWSFQMTPYPGYVPGYAGTVGGSTAVITQE
jgi:hypothetical protein